MIFEEKESGGGGRREGTPLFALCRPFSPLCLPKPDLFAA